MSDAPHSLRPVTLLVAALGGQGGGVLANWIVNAAQARDLPVQATSIPGVAQRTGSTTYYVEIWPQPWSALDARVPLLALSPAPGELDVLAVSELLEAGRAIRAGFVTPQRTLLIAATDRVYTTAEKMQMGDGRFDPDALHRAAHSQAQATLLLELDRLAREAGAPPNAVLLGAIAGCGRLPIPVEAFREGVRAEGKAAEANLRGFEAGLAALRTTDSSVAASPSGSNSAAAPRQAAARTEALLAQARRDFPPLAHTVLGHGVRRLVDYQDARYGALYLERLAPFREGESAVLESVARHLAVRMSYEDAIRVAQAKARPERLARVRAETGAAPGEPVRITEFLKPGLEEISDILPVPLARALLWLARRWPRLGRMRRGMYVRTSTVRGYATLRGLAGLRRWRRASWRYGREQAAIETWLDQVRRAAGLHPRLAGEIAECARLIKGYGDTHERGTGNYARIEAALIAPALMGPAHGGGDPLAAADAIAAARTAALADPEGDALQQALEQTPAGGSGSALNAADAPNATPPRERAAG